MKVLLIGATGNLGLRLIAALLTHNHTVIAFIRSSSKLESLLPEFVYRRITVIEGDATNSFAIKKAILDFECDALINTAGVAALEPWATSDLPTIFRAVVNAALEVGSDRNKPLRAWFLGGLGVLNYPGSDSMLSDYIPIYLEHRQNLQLLKSLPADALDWSMLCPSTMTPESPTIAFPTVSSRGTFIANATTPPLWQDSWMEYIPLLGKPIVCAINAARYETSLEQNAEFLAGDLGNLGSQWRGSTVGVIDGSK